MKKIREHNKLIFLAIVAIIFTAGYIWLLNSAYFEGLIQWSSGHEYIYMAILLLLKIFGTIYPPVPGVLLTLGSIPIIGWQRAYMIDFIGSMIGTTIAFYLGKKYGHKILDKFLDKKNFEAVKKLKVKEKNEIEFVVVSRVTLGTTLGEVTNYATGMLNVKYYNFFIGSIIVHIVFAMPLFYFAFNLFGKENIILSLGLVVFAIALFLKMRNRYFEKA